MNRSRLFVIITLGVLGAGALGVAGMYLYKQMSSSSKLPIACVSNDCLYKEDFIGLGLPGNSPKDSLEVARRFVDNWVRKKLMLSKAEQEIAYDETELVRKVEEYRYSLLVYELEKKYVTQHLDTSITDDEINAYYQQNQASFLLKNPVIHALYVQLPVKNSRTEEVRKLMQDFNPSQKSILEAICKKEASQYALQDREWINLESLLSQSPFQSYLQSENFLNKKKFRELRQDNQTAFLYILDYRLPGQTAPLEMVRPQIQEIIVNQRITKLRQQLEKETYEQAKKDKKFEIYEN
jgi:hypothetical protein